MLCRKGPIIYVLIMVGGVLNHISSIVYTVVYFIKPKQK